MSKINQQCGNPTKANCTIALKDVTKFDWDKMYLFPDWTISDSISNYLGFPYLGDDVPDDNTRIVFTKNGKVVYEEDFVSLDYHNSTMIFSTGNNDNFYTGKNYLKPSTAVFKVEKLITESGCEKCFIYDLVK